MKDFYSLLGYAIDDDVWKSWQDEFPGRRQCSGPTSFRKIAKGTHGLI